MIQFLKFSNKIVLASAILIVFTSCKHSTYFGNGIDGNGNVTTQTRNFTEDFTSIQAKNGLEVEIAQSNQKLITVEADENLQQHIITRVENGVLIIETNENIDDAKSKKVTVKLPIFTGVTSSSGSSVTSMNVLKGEALKIESSSGSEVELSLEVDSILCLASSGSSIAINGKALNLETSSSSGSEIDAGKLLTNTVTAQSKSGSSINVHPILSLKAHASSGSSIDYNNLPKTISKEESSGGSISQK